MNNTERPKGLEGANGAESSVRKIYKVQFKKYSTKNAESVDVTELLVWGIFEYNNNKKYEIIIKNKIIYGRVPGDPSQHAYREGISQAVHLLIVEFDELFNNLRDTFLNIQTLFRELKNTVHLMMVK